MIDIKRSKRNEKETKRIAQIPAQLWFCLKFNAMTKNVTYNLPVFLVFFFLSLLLPLASEITVAEGGVFLRKNKDITCIIFRKTFCGNKLTKNAFTIVFNL
jgi:hypothetical protein